MSFSATEAAFEGFRLVRRNPMALVWWTLAYLAFLALLLAAGGSSLISIITMMDQFSSGGREPSVGELEAMGQAYFGIIAWALPLTVLFGAMLSAAVARGVVRPREGAFGYLRIGMDEVRVIVVTLVLMILFCAVMFAGGLAVGVVVGLASAGDSSWGLLAGIVVGLLMAALAIWLMVRFSLAIPITVAERRIAIFDSFGLTKGRFWPLLGMAVLAAVMSLVVAILGGLATLPITMMTGGMAALRDLENASLLEIARTAWPTLLALGVVRALLSALQLAVIYAPFSAAYRDLTGKGEAA